jgi:macrolide-specific efflux system membrane fusion protein
VNIITAEANDVLMAPNKAIKTSAGQQSVVVLFEGQQISVPVTVGLVGDSYSQIVSTQLREGDVLVLNGASSTSASAGNSTTEREFMGPMGDFGGGQPPAGIP